MIGGTMAQLDCTVWAAKDGGDHTIFIGQVENASSFGDRDDLAPLLYFAGKYRDAGASL
jgi:flavin reductase (DIM6/NTAB) family NADH-FMN oxidoreductase RutF